MSNSISLKTILKHMSISFYALFTIAMIGGNLFSGILTLLPSEVVGWGATEVNYLGYVSHCSFTPWSTLISFLLVASGILMLVHFVSLMKPLVNKEFVREYLISMVLGISLFVFPFIVISIYIAVKLLEHFKPEYSNTIRSFFYKLFGFQTSKTETK